MIESRIQRKYNVVESDRMYDGRFVGGLYPDARIDDRWFQKLGASEDAPELKGLKPEGFTEDGRFDTQDFDMEKLREVRETALRYFRRLECFDCEADLDHVLPLVRELHSCPESLVKGELQAGELILALWMADIPFMKMKGAGGGFVFAVDWDEISDPLNYMDEKHGYENLLRPTTGWMLNEHIPLFGSDIEFISIYPKVQRGALSGPYPVCATA